MLGRCTAGVRMGATPPTVVHGATTNQPSRTRKPARDQGVGACLLLHSSCTAESTSGINRILAFKDSVNRANGGHGKFAVVVVGGPNAAITKHRGDLRNHGIAPAGQPCLQSSEIPTITQLLPFQPALLERLPLRQRRMKCSIGIQELPRS